MQQCAPHISRHVLDFSHQTMPWCITLDNSKGISRLRFGAKNSRVNGINDLPVFMHQGIKDVSVCTPTYLFGVRRHRQAN